MNTPIPIIRMELDGFKMAFAMALHEHQLQIDANFKAAVDQFCTPENLTKIISDKANTVMRQVLEEEVQRFFSYGVGREVIREAVEKKLKENERYVQR